MATKEDAEVFGIVHNITMPCHCLKVKINSLQCNANGRALGRSSLCFDSYGRDYRAHISNPNLHHNNRSHDHDL